jgi:esterase/lipase superfamily enzyme
MVELKLYYATNRNHEGKDRWHPTGYGTKFSQDGMENLRFGVVKVDAQEDKLTKLIKADLKEMGTGDGEKLADYLGACARKARIEAYPENLSQHVADVAQPDAKFGSLAMFEDIMQEMQSSTDVVVYIHGFNTSWISAVGSALALQTMLRDSPNRDPAQNLAVVLFTWPSDGMAMPWASYKSDRSEAAGSGAAVGRALLKLRDFLRDLRDKARQGGRELCGQDIHLLCHSMGNYLLQHALARIADFTPGNSLPRIFEHIFLCAPDVDDKALEARQPLGNVDQLARCVTLYHNREDTAMVVSDYTKGNPDRLGGAGAAHPAQLHNKVNQVDCTPIVQGIVEHSYYLSGHVNADIRASIDGKELNDPKRRRALLTAPNIWVMKK